VPTFRSIRVRLTIWYLLLLAVTLAVFSVAVYLALRQSLYDNLDDALESRSELVAGIVAGGGLEGLDAGDIPGDPVEGEEFVRVYDASGNLMYDNTASAFRPAEDPAGVQSALSGRTTRRDVDAGGVSLRVVIEPIEGEGGTLGVVEVGLSEDDVSETLQRLLVIIAIAYPLALVLAGLGGVILADRALSPIDRVTRAARQITAEDLSQRLDLDLPDDEVGRLAQTFDEMIARLDAAFRRQREFTADASHELRTPLTAIKGQAEVALQRERDPDAYREVLYSINSEVDRMIRLVAGLLTLARADSGQLSLSRGPVDPGEIISGAVEQVRGAAEQKGISLDAANGPPVIINADKDLLWQLLLNLLDNAVKFTPAGGEVVVAWRLENETVAIEVADNGRGIPPEHLDRVFDRFYRADPARSSDGGGAGLGLSISRWIAEAHGGSIAAESTLGEGARFIVRLPLN
jgi:heavy metal sensor kinase